MAEGVEALRLTEWVIAGCTLAGPVLAVQAQKWIEGFREKNARRLTIFRTLMAILADYVFAVLSGVKRAAKLRAQSEKQ